MHSGCPFLTDRGVVKEGLFYFLLHFSFFFLLIFLFLCSTAVFHVAVKVSVLVSRVSNLNGRGCGFGKCRAAAFPREGQDLHSLPQPCSGMCLKVCLWDGSGYPGGNPLTVRGQERGCAGLTSRHAAFGAIPAILPQPRPVGPRLCLGNFAQVLC